MAEDERQCLTRIRPNLERRALIYELTRAFFRGQGFLEIETPLRVPVIAPEPHITPFKSQDWFLSTSPELHMKRLLAAGYEKLFQISRCFRHGERGRHHNPEFVMLEWYRTGANYLDMVSDTEQLVTFLTDRLGLGRTIRYGDKEIDLALPWPRTTVREAFLGGVGWDPTVTDDPRRFDTDLVTRVIPGFDPRRPTVITDYPAPMAALARLKPTAPPVAERAEVFIAGLELTNGYSELTDAREQEERFREDLERIRRERGQRLPMPQRFLQAVAGLPPCGGIALGMDRLVMLLSNAGSIDDVTAFTVDNV